MSRIAIVRALLALVVLAVSGGAASSGLAGPAAVTILGGVYAADDGGALYLRVADGVVWGFSEHPGRDYAYVLRGTTSGDRIQARWWDVPKHGRTTAGDVELQVSQAGARLVRKSADKAIGQAVFTRLPSTAGFPWPKTDRDAGFQSTSTGDLDGKFVGSDGSRFYVRETGGEVVGIGELRTGSKTRPDWTAVFVGERTSGGGAVAGSYADVPKGTRTAKGGLGIGLVTGKREGSIVLTSGGSRSVRPDYSVDFARMATLIDGALRNRVVGYGFAVSKDDAVVAEGAGGSRRLGQDDPSGRNQALGFNVTTQNEAASSTKLVTAAMLIRTLQERGITLDAKVAGALPSCWSKGPGITNTMGGLTWKQLLNHTSRLTRPSACDNNPYECLRRAVAAGRIGPATDDKGNARQYQNINFTILRYMIPILRDKPAVDAIFTKYACRAENGAKINAEVSERYRHYVMDEVLGPLGIQGSFEPVTEFAIRYDFSNPTAKGIRPSGKDILEAASGGMKWSAHEFAEFLAALETGKLVSPSYLRTMRSELLGYDGNLSGTAGSYPWKNGGAGGTMTMTVSFPSGVAAFITVNSDNNNLASGLGGILQSAFDGSIR